MFKVILILLSSLVFSSTVYAREEVEVCAKYRKSGNWASEWSKEYKVSATMLNGSEMNKIMGGYDYSYSDKFVVIFWGKNQATVLKLNDTYLGYSSTKAYEQNGDEWEVRKGSYCY
jgi:hypothetical protein